MTRGEARIDSISLTVDLAEANKRRRASAQESKDAARAALLFGRPLTGRERPADDAVPCVVTLKGPDPRCLAAVGEEVGRELRQAGKRPRDEEGRRDGERTRYNWCCSNLVRTVATRCCCCQAGPALL